MNSTTSDSVSSMMVSQSQNQTGSPDDKYRFYQCVLEPLYTYCYPLKQENAVMATSLSGKNTRLVPIASWVPSIADRAIVRMRLFQDSTLTFHANEEEYNRESKRF